MWIDYASVIRESEEQLRGLERKYRGNSRVANPVCMFQSMISPSKSSGDRCCC